MWFKRFSCQHLLIALFLFVGVSSYAQPNATEGKALFKAKCAQCHAPDMKSKSTGPALGPAEENWSAYPREDLYSWVRNSQKMVESGHPRAAELWGVWGPSVMNNFPNLTDDQIDGIFLYINEKYNAAPEVVETSTGTGGDVGGQTNYTFYFILIAILGLLALILARIVSNLNHMAKSQEEGTAPPKRKTLVELLLSPMVIGALIFGLVIIGGYTTVNNAIDLGRQQGYQPQQPIKFSHVTHAGEQKIDCQYCHDGARRSKHSVIPATNTCMNCHASVRVGSKHGTAELSKIYASAGWNPNTGTYFDNFEDMKPEEVEKEFRKWFDDNFKEAKGAEVKEELVKENADLQWDGVQEFVNNPIEWVRIHNLPDHVYFNHAQHVSVGKVECQTCHGPVEEMEVVQQYSPLSMGWCVNCHRQTEVKFADNPYYDSYEEYHEQMKSGDRTGVTVEEIGGLECQKCHY